MNDKLVSVILPGNSWVLQCCAWHQWALDKGLFDEDDEAERYSSFRQLLVLLSAARQGASPVLDDVLTKTADDVALTLREYADKFMLTGDDARNVEMLVQVLPPEEEVL